jgi:hypothetical protein
MTDSPQPITEMMTDAFSGEAGARIRLPRSATQTQHKSLYP